MEQSRQFINRFHLFCPSSNRPLRTISLNRVPPIDEKSVQKHFVAGLPDFQTKNTNLSFILGGGLWMENVGIFFGHLEYLTAIWYICIFCGQLVYFSPFWVCCSKKNMATLFRSVRWTYVRHNFVGKYCVVVKYQSTYNSLNKSPLLLKSRPGIA
jgi:hypothetical protein